MANAQKIDDDQLGEFGFSKLREDLLSGDALEMICIIPRENGSVDRFRFFTDDQGILRRSLL